VRLELSHSNLQLIFPDLLIGQQINRMRQLDLDLETFRGPLLKTGKCGVDHEPGRKRIGRGLVKNEVTLFGEDAEAHRRKLYVEAGDHRAVRKLAFLRD